MLQSHNHIRLSLSAFTAIKSLIRNRIITKYFLFEKKPFLILSLCSCGTIIFFSTLILGLYLSWFKRMVETYGFYLIETNFSFFFFFFCLYLFILFITMIFFCQILSRELIFVEIWKRDTYFFLNSSYYWLLLLILLKNSFP